MPWISTPKTMSYDPYPSEESFQERRQRERGEPYEDRPRQDGNDVYGHRASSPGEIPKRGWMEVLKRTARQIEGDHLPLISAGVAFFLLLGLFPSLAAMVSIYGWLADPATVAGHVDQISTMLPREAAAIIRSQIEKVAGAPTAAGWGAIIGVVLALWAGSKATKGIVEAMNIAYNQKEERGFIRKQLVYFSLTLAAVLAGLLSILMIAVIPAIVDFLPIPEVGKGLLVWLRWPALLALGMTIIALIYRFAPSRRKAKWRWVSWGAGTATVLWLVASALFSFYVSNFGNFNETYGSLGAVIILMMWLYLTSFLVLMGAELDAELELQTQRDTTTGEEKEMGERGAFTADHVSGHP
jgi:membrane protein